ncbi:cobalamin biosynthesis protein CobD [Mariprofundus ferrooxydans]|nr:cobalamin biosynthesis protein CobD [Mariprofundus ferrooxydans]
MTLMLALLLEWVVGDPQSRLHPVALFGRWASWCESFLYADSRQRGFMAYVYVLSIPFTLLWLAHHQIGWPFDVLLLWLSIGWKSLFEHVQAVLESRSKEQMRVAIAKIVSRDTADMSQEDAHRAALESLAENASDAVVAPLFWFVLLGPLGAAIYRMVNTLDAMWGYRNERYNNFGFCAAKLDDVANWIPARITARLILWVGQSTPWSTVEKQASTHVSPNAGWPEVALAYAADVKLGGPVKRAGVIEERPFYGADDARAMNATAAFDALLIVRNSLLIAAVAAMVMTLVF